MFQIYEDTDAPDREAASRRPRQDVSRRYGGRGQRRRRFPEQADASS